MASTNKTQVLKLNQWELGDKPAMEDFNRDNQTIDEMIVQTTGSAADKVMSQAAVSEELAEKADGNWRFYSGLAELGIAVGTEIVESIARAMQDRSELYYLVNTSASGHADIYPYTYGTMRVTRINYSRTLVKFYGVNGSSEWLGGLNLADPVAWKGWKQFSFV